VFEVPNDEVPSVTWYPMDKLAEASLVKLSDAIKTIPGHMPFVIHKLHDLSGAKLPEVEVLEAPAKQDPDQPPMLPGLKQVESLGPTMSELQRSQRPSDKEPTKR
jgi:hypothetical protein